MRPELHNIPLQERVDRLKSWLGDGGRIGLITSLDGNQLIALVLNPLDGTAQIWESPLETDEYPSLTPSIPQCHWFERTVWDMFGLKPHGHPRLKHNLLHEPYASNFFPLHPVAILNPDDEHRVYHHLEVKGEGIFEIPVGPIHAGIIEPGHFRFSCLGEVIVNLEIRLGYVHRGIEKRLTEVPWKKARFTAEAAAGDMVAANALAHAIAIESILDIKAPPRAEALRSISLEIERTAMHIADLGGIAGDIGFLAVASSMARLRGNALRMGEILAGTRFQKAYIKPGGVVSDVNETSLRELRETASQLKRDLAPVIKLFFDNQVACDRMKRIGRVSPKLAKDFSLVGVAGRASGVRYDARMHFPHGVFPHKNFAMADAKDGDVFSRAAVRAQELNASLEIIDELISTLPAGSISSDLPDCLPADRAGLGIVESHRGELIHLVFTNKEGNIRRYAIKDPSLNNWTGLAIAIRNNLVPDFPLCNKSFSLSYSGHDL